MGQPDPHGPDRGQQQLLHPGEPDPNSWGQKALRNCVRQAYDAGLPRGGTCTRAGNGLNGLGEPVMGLG
jgi:hypothetical protein